jgi:hypothetical protein
MVTTSELIQNLSQDVANWKARAIGLWTVLENADRLYEDGKRGSTFMECDGALKSILNLRFEFASPCRGAEYPDEFIWIDNPPRVNLLCKELMKPPIYSAFSQEWKDEAIFKMRDIERQIAILNCMLRGDTTCLPSRR